MRTFFGENKVGAMSENRWENVGDQIRNTVDDAIRRCDFSDLSGNIHRMINTMMDNVGLPRIKPRVSAPPPPPPVRLYDRRARGRASGTLMRVFGWMGIVLFGFLAIGYMAILIIPAAVVFAVFAALFAVMTVAGTRRVYFADRFQAYIDVIRDRVTVPLAELAGRVGKSVDFTGRELQAMIAQRMFYQAHVDEDSQCLIMTDAAYRNYLEAKRYYDQRQMQEAAARQERQRQEEEAAAKAGQLPPECRQLINEGESYIQYIRDSNARIPGDEMTGKLVEMERLITRIFDTVRLHPEVAGDLKKLMSYYLPTTKKLLDTYQELDHQPISGENISSTKREIEEAVDALNLAFGKLLDGLYESRAWDVSSDISVLKTVLAQDGLGDDGLHGAKNP